MKAKRSRLVGMAAVLAAFCVLYCGGCSQEDNGEALLADTAISAQTDTESASAADTQASSSSASQASAATVTITYSTLRGMKPAAKKVELTDSVYKLTAQDLPVLSATGYTFTGWSLTAPDADEADSAEASTTETSTATTSATTAAAVIAGGENHTGHHFLRSLGYKPLLSSSPLSLPHNKVHGHRRKRDNRHIAVWLLGDG